MLNRLYKPSLAELATAKEALDAWRDIKETCRAGDTILRNFAKERIEDLLSRYPEIS